MLILCNNIIDTDALRVENVSIQSKAMGWFGLDRWNDTSKPIERYSFVRVIILKNLTTSSDRFDVFILLGVTVVE